MSVCFCEENTLSLSVVQMEISSFFYRKLSKIKSVLLINHKSSSSFNSQCALTYYTNTGLCQNHMKKKHPVTNKEKLIKNYKYQ